MAMITGPAYTFRRGEPIVIGREVVSGDPTGYTVTASLKKTLIGRSMPPASAPVAATFDVEFQAAGDGHGARWLFSLTAEDAAALSLDTYVVDARFELAGEPVEITEPALVIIVESVSG